MVPLAIVVHVSAEFVALGLRESSSAMLARHVYLLFVGAVAFFVLAVLSNCFGSREERSRRLRYIVEGLPFDGKGARFAVFVFATQSALFVASQAFELFPICRGNLLIALFVALLLCIAATVLVAALPLPALRREAIRYFARAYEQICKSRPRANYRIHQPSISVIVVMFRAVIGNRPPPRLLAN